MTKKEKQGLSEFLTRLEEAIGDIRAKLDIPAQDEIGPSGDL